MSSITEVLANVKTELGDKLNGRIEKAETLAAGGHVTRLDDYTWTVKSQGSDKQYLVAFELQWRCNCADFNRAPVVEFGGSVQPVCKHILAVFACWVTGDYPSPRPAALYDLVIATKKAPFVSGADGHILWWKLAGKEKETPLARMYLTAPEIQKALLRYKLVDTEALSTAIVRRYQLLETEEN